jgi:hypothetical protein
VEGNNQCVSACALIWLAGSIRSASSNSLIGFHAATDATGREGLGSALIGKYLAELGFNDDAVAWMTVQDAEHVNLLDLDVVRQLKLNMRVYDTEKQELYDFRDGQLQGTMKCERGLCKSSSK